MRDYISGLFRPRSLEVLEGGYTREKLLGDVMGGVTVGLIALPLALALGVASVPFGAATPFPAPAVGLFTAIIAGFIVSALGGSRVQIAGPTAAFMPIVLLIIERYGYDGLLLATIMAGIILVVMGLARMGAVIKFIPYPVTSGFTTGIAVSIILSQVPDFLGITGGAPQPREFLDKIPWFWAHLPAINPMAAGTGLSCALLIYVWPRFGWSRLPGIIVATVVASVGIATLGWSHAHGVATVGMRFGPNAIPSSFPPFTVPIVTMERIRGLIAPACTIAILGSIESLLSAVVADGLINDRHNANTELIAQGLANIVCPFFCGLPATGAIARTSANIRSGGTTPVSGMVHSLTLLVIVLAFSRYGQFVPMAAIAAVLVMVALRMGEWHELARLRQMPRSDAVVLVATMALTVVFDLTVAVQVGMVMAAVLFIRRIAETTEVSRVTASDELETHEQVAHGKEIPEGVLVYRIFGPFFFGAAEKMEDAMEGMGQMPRALILRMQLVPAMDATALNALESITERVQASGGVLILSGPHRQPLQMLAKAGFIDRIGRKNICAHFDGAMERAREVLANGP
ncbi:MAG TPA: SulP family inorganic anion transporter [Opitutaceae bacterium]|nr:SulP family inorganic anion transporter [Opitutaceae bacterium]